jgi:hypothetical protein
MPSYEELHQRMHLWHRCHACGSAPINGLRFDCQTCPVGPDNSLCEACYKRYLAGMVKHPAVGTTGEYGSLVTHQFEVFDGEPSDSYLPWLAGDVPAVRMPAFPDRSVVRPEFRCGPESYFGPYAFAVSIRDECIVLTALHAMDEIITKFGINCSADGQEYTGGRLQEIITEVRLYDIFAKRWMFAELEARASMLHLPMARIRVPEPYSDLDIAAFRVKPCTALCPLRLAAFPPQRGEPVWLAVNAQSETGRRALEAVVVEITERSLIFRFKGAEIPRRTSGAPLLDRFGNVVGINVGGGKMKGFVFGHANHVANIRCHLNDVGLVE